MSAHGHEHAAHPPIYYIKIWAVLLVLLIVSLIGPMIGIRWLTIVTAFGIALIKALMVCAYFMHLNVEKKYIWYVLFTMLLMVTLFFFGTKVDVNHLSGQNWTKEASAALIEKNKNWHDEMEHHEGGGASSAHTAPATEHK